MTALGSITHHTLWIECRCGHVAPVRASSLIVRLGPEATVSDAVRRMRCGRCHARMVERYVIVYEGGSAEAMQGARQTLPLGGHDG